MTKIRKLNFEPLPGLSSGHLQTILHVYCPKGKPPPSKNLLVELDKTNQLSCEISTPLSWKEHHKTIALVHGLGGSHDSNYMIRLSRKFYQNGEKVIRINLRGCGSGKGLSHLPYNAGTSADILKVIQHLKKNSPASEIILIGFSLGGNIILKLAGELGTGAKNLIKTFIAVCAPLDLAHTLKTIERKRHAIYHSYFLKNMCRQAPVWISQRVKTIYEFDNLITAPLWGYRDADDYYQKCSSIQFLPEVRHNTHLVIAEDDPFICTERLKSLHLNHEVNLWSSKYGGHLGFLGRIPKTRDIYWIDHLLLNWVNSDLIAN